MLRSNYCVLKQRQNSAVIAESCSEIGQLGGKAGGRASRSLQVSTPSLPCFGLSYCSRESSMKADGRDGQAGAALHCAASFLQANLCASSEQASEMMMVGAEIDSIKRRTDRVWLAQRLDLHVPRHLFSPHQPHHPPATNPSLITLLRTAVTFYLPHETEARDLQKYHRQAASIRVVGRFRDPFYLYHPVPTFPLPHTNFSV
jgi:hypothetical protein